MTPKNHFEVTFRYMALHFMPMFEHHEVALLVVTKQASMVCLQTFALQ